MDKIMFLLLVLIMFGIVLTIGSYSVHRSMTRDIALDNKAFIYKINFKEFSDLFNSITDWENQSRFRGSLFSKSNNLDNKGYIHASLIYFHGNMYMLRNILEYVKYLFWTIKHLHQKRIKNEVDYSDHKVRLELNKKTKEK